MSESIRGSETETVSSQEVSSTPSLRNVTVSEVSGGKIALDVSVKGIPLAADAATESTVSALLASVTALEALVNSLLTAVYATLPPHKFGYVPMRKAFEFTTMQTDTVIWPAPIDKRIVITGFYLVANGNTDASVRLFDETNTLENTLYLADMDVSMNSPLVVCPGALGTPFITADFNRNIKVTTSADIKISGVLFGYEAID